MIYHLSESLQVRRQMLQIVIPDGSMVTDVLRSRASPTTLARLRRRRGTRPLSDALIRTH